ncbi:unnamed protein product [Miscanthus lutarioriparius]|uniref:DUF4283 domain-containing protein n=1 Tax=Miscanthus lutarioriparius TaxID=422564 RepID=A0A811S581_9POAL|nr:unnamed protein product [Miscanthus lutarioriparius]
MTGPRDGGGPMRPDHPRGVPRSLLWWVEAPPASPRTRARMLLLELIVVPCTPALQAGEDALSLALLAMVVGTRPAVTPAMVRLHLLHYYGIAEVSVRRARPDDFIMRFTNQEDLDAVLGTPSSEGAPFALRWRRWSRLIMGSAGTFRYRVLISMKGIPSHVRSSEVAQVILDSSGAKAEIANLEALDDPDDERELFIAAWCARPDLIPDEKIMAMPEPKEEHDGGSPLYLRPHEINHDEVPMLRYLVRLRIIEFQDWHTPPQLSDED